MEIYPYITPIDIFKRFTEDPRGITSHLDINS